MNIRLQQLAFTVIFVVFGTVAVAQPNITYTSPPTYLVSSPIITLSPANTGGAVATYGYSTISTNFVTPVSASYSVT